MFRLAAGGWISQTNSFVQRQTTLKDIRLTPGWPTRLTSALDSTQPLPNIPIAGFVRHMHTQQQRVHPVLWMTQATSGLMEDAAYEQLKARFLQQLATLLPLDGLFLELQGGLATPTRMDGEAQLLAEIRALVGEDCHIVATFDMQANLSHAMLQHIDWLTTPRLQPQTDRAEAGERAAAAMMRLLMDGLKGRLHTSAMQRIPFLIPLSQQTTHTSPMQNIMQLRKRLEPEGATLEFLTGFPLMDSPHTGPTVVCHGYGMDVLDAVEKLKAHILSLEAAFDTTLFSPRMAVRHARQQYRGKPVILIDTQDNPAAGGTGDTTGLLEAMLEEKASHAVLGLLYDPLNAAKAQQVGVGGKAIFYLGSHSGMKGHYPCTAEFTVEHVINQPFQCTGQLMGGVRLHLGPMAVLRHEGVRVILSSVRHAVADPAVFKHVGIHLDDVQILALKTGLHFRTDMAPLAGDVLTIAAPGATPEDPSRLDYRHLQQGIRLLPGGFPFRESVLKPRKAS